MTRKLEDLFNMPEDTTPDEEQPESKKKTKEKVDDAVAMAMQKVSRKEDFDIRTDIELDSIADDAKKTYDDLMDLGMNVDSRYSARLFEVASTFLKISLDAKNAKVNKVLKSMDIQHRQERLQSRNNQLPHGGSVVNNDHMVTDRNSLLEKLRKLN